MAKKKKETIDYKSQLEAISNGNYTYKQQPNIMTTVAQPEKTGGYFDDGYQFGDITKSSINIVSNAFNKNNRFQDGYQIGDVSKTLLGSAIDIERNLKKGAASTVEGAADFGINLLSGLFDEDTAQSMRNFAQKDITGELSRLNLGSTFGGFYKIADLIDSKDIASLNPFDKEAQARYDERLQKNSLSGDTADQLAQGLGQLGGQVALQSIGIPWQFTAFTSSAGNEMNNAFQNNATYGQAFVSGLISGAVEVGTEYLGGGANKFLGMTSLGSKAIEKLGGKISNKLVAMLTKAGLDMAGEGLEEVLSGYGTAIGQKLTYMSDKEINELYSSEEALEEFISGALVSGIANIPGSIQTVKRGANAFTGMTDNEQKVYDKLVEERTEEAQEKSEKKLTKKQIEAIENDVMDDFTKGNISTDKIESILGHADNVHYMVNQAENMSGRPLTPEELNDINLEAYENYAESIKKDDIIKRNYYEDELRHQKFNVDLDSLDDNMKKFYQTQIDEGVVDNSTKAHNYMDMMAKIWKDKGIMSHVITDEIATKTLIDDAVKKYMEDNNITSLTTEQRQELENKYKEEFKDTRVNGYMRDGELYININSKNALETIVGHEITHLLEKNTDLYDNLRKSLKEYAESKGEYKNRLDAIKSQPGYNNLTEDAQTKELTADLVGDYIFTSQDYINSLAQNRNLFQKIYDEIKYLVKQVTAGSDEQRKLNKAMKMFEKAYRENSVKLAEQENTKYSITKDNGIQVINDYINSNNYVYNNNGVLKVNNLNDKQIKDLVKIYHATGYEDVSTDYLVNRLKEGNMPLQREIADRFIEKELGYKPTIDTTQIFEDAEGNPLTKEQVEFYKDSGVRDIRGRLIPLYHRTNADFTVFDEKAGTQHGKKYGKGFYFSTTPENYGNNTMKVYLNAKDGEFKYVPKMGYYIVQEPNMVKNVDNKAPTDNPDIRYSLTTDSNGRELTEQQQEYFKDSKVRDENGKLVPVYHGTTEEINVFDKNRLGNNTGAASAGEGFFFTDSKKVATDYSRYARPQDIKDLENEYKRLEKIAQQKRTKEAWDDYYRAYEKYEEAELSYAYNEDNQRTNAENLKEVYLNLTNPLIHDFKGMEYRDESYYDLLKQAKENGNDGAIFKNTYDGYGEKGTWENPMTNIYVAFESNQIKNVDNLNPTEDVDIRYSLTQKVDTELDDLTNEQYEYFKNTKAVDIDGELEVVYHGTPHEFSVFDIEKAGETGLMFGNGFYFTTSQGRAEAFIGDNDNGLKSGYVNIEKPASRDTKTMTYNEFYNLYNALNENPNMYDDEMGMSNIDALLSDYGDIYNDKENTIKKFYDSYDDDVSLIDNLSYIGNPAEMYKTLRDVTGYDGIIVEKPSDFSSERWFVAFNPDQFKLKSNKTPTDNVDMNLSLSQQDEIAPTRKPGLTYGEDIAYQEDIAPTGIDYTIDRDIMDLFHQEIARKGGKKVQLTKPVIAKEKSSLRNSLDTLSTMFVNQNTEIDNLAKESGNKNIKFAGDMLNNYSAEAQNDIAVAQTDNYGNAIGKSVQQLFETAKEKGLEAPFNDYLINYSNIDRWNRGKGSQTPVDVSERLVANYEAKYPQFKKWAKDVWKFGENVRKNWLEAGMIKQEMFDLLSESYPHYVPYISDTNNFDAAMDKLNELKAKPIKRAVGGATELFPVEEALTRYTFAQKRAYRQNELFKQIYNTLQTNPGQRGADVGEGYFTGEEPNLYRDDSGNYITALFDGEEHRIQVSDDLFKSLRNDMQTQIKDLENKLSIITKPLQTASNIRRKMLTSWSPSFTITNPLKDIQDAFFNSKHLKEMAKNYIPGIKELWTGSTPEARQFLALYGEGNLMGQFENESGLYDAKKGNKNNKFLKGLSKVNNIMELAPRYAEFKASLQAGESLAESMYNAREITTNFSRGGVITKALNRNGFTFLNASVQGFDKFIRNFSGENGARGIASSLLRAVMLGVAPAVFNELAFGGGDDKDEDYDALPDYIKDNYYLIKTGDGTFVRIPKGRMLSVFGSAARRTIEALEGEENAFEGYLSNVNNQIGINNPEENNIFSPFIQAYGSKNGTAWYGGDIVPTRLQDKPKSEQYDASTDKMSIWLGEHLGISPYKINYVLDQYTGGIGDIILPMITDEATSNGSLLAPVVDKFTADSTTDNKYVSDFYTKNDELKVQANSSEATDDDYLRNEYMKSISKEMSKLYAERRDIQADNSLSKSEKYEKSQAIKDQINKLAKYGLDSYDNISVTGNYAEVGDDMGYYKNAKGNWTPIDQKDIIATESIGLTDREKSTYYGIKNDMYNIDQKYEPKLKTASDEEKTVLNAQKKVDIINSIKNANLPDEAKAKLYDKKYASTETLDAVINCGIDFDSYLDLQAQNFTADKNIYGKTINGSKKNKVYNYINNLDMPYEQKIMLAKLEYKSDDTYNREIIDYLNNDNSISYQDMTEILKAMGFKVDEYGNITWE